MVQARWTGVCSRGAQPCVDEAYYAPALCSFLQLGCVLGCPRAGRTRARRGAIESTWCVTWSCLVITEHSSNVRAIKGN